ncbi:unnamed protein product, partial [Mesorhabditis spiculigera]
MDERPLSNCKYYAAPMVRYSKLVFRKLVRLYNVDCCFTPMIYAKEFLQSDVARNSEFTTDTDDHPLIVQFASNDPVEFAAATELVYKYSNGVDLNCGCPKGDVRARGYGSSLLTQPELLADIVRQTRNRISDDKFAISLKIRIQDPLERTVDLCRKAAAAGVNHLTAHARYHWERMEAPHYETIAVIKDAVDVPIILNGGVKTLEEANRLLEETRCDGIMAANGLLNNPTLFSGEPVTTWECVQKFISLSVDHGLTFHLFHQHLAMMLDNVLTPRQRTRFNETQTMSGVVDFLENAYNPVLPPLRVAPL